jgi:two-component system sensor histidine kinase UhpB
MRLALKHQILLAPATVLLLMTGLLCFLQYTYWELSHQRQEAKRLGTIFIALGEADLSAQRLAAIVQHLDGGPLPQPEELNAMQELYAHLSEAVSTIENIMPLGEEAHAHLQQTLNELNPDRGFEPRQYLSNLNMLRPQLVKISESLQNLRSKLRAVHSQNIDEIVARTALVSVIVLAATILLGILLSLAFARGILRRIKFLSESAGRIARGELVPPPAPEKVKDELDDLGLSINRMTERLIRVVGAEKLLEGAEEERRRIAMDIHDQTLSDLSSVLRGIQGLKAEGQGGEEVVRLQDELQKAMTNLREVMDNLHPQTLEILGLGAALESHLERHLAKDGLPEYHLYISPEIEAIPLSRVVRLTLYRIAIEAIHNVIKHSRATRYEVNMARRGHEIVMSVEDNGVGFKPGQTTGGGGRGLNNIRERAHAIGAKATWGASRFTSGTRFELILPLNDIQNNGEK